jgi:PAS domain S-box-containing protein
MVRPTAGAEPLDSNPGGSSLAARRSGIDVIGDVTWGTHFCLFYQTKEDLLDILLPYFKAGLEQNEFCMWVTSEPLVCADARKALAAAVGNLDEHVDRGQIEILDHADWYTRSGRFEADEVLQGWVSKETQAVKEGFDGLRLTGNTLWLEKGDWKSFSEYEKRVNEIIGEHRMIAVCTYSLERCGAPEIMDVLSTHQFALVERAGKWEVVESAERKRVDEALRRRDRELSIKNRVDHIFSTVLGDEMYDGVLQIVLQVTRSERGFFGYIDQDGALVLPSLTRDVWEQCQVPDKDIVFPREKWGGIWGQALIERRTLLSNEPGRVPEGHIPVQRTIVAPIVSDSDVIGVISIANKPTDYDADDIRLLERVASHLAPALRARLQRNREEHHRKLAEEKLRQYGERLEELVEERTAELQSINALLERIFSTTHILIAYMDADFNFIRVNRAYAEAGGHTPEFYVGKNHFELFPYAENESIFRQVVETGQSHTAHAKPFEYAERPERGVTYWDWTLQPVSDASGRMEGVVLVLVDVSERVRAQETLLESEENFRALAENAGDGIVILRRDATLAYANRRAGEISGYGVSELQEMTLSELMNVGELHKVTDRLERRISGEPAPPHYETAIIKKDGGTLPVEIAGARTVWHGKPADLVIVRDISARKASEAALIQSEKLALTGRLAASLAHEINNPLQTVIGCLGLAEESLTEEGDAHRYLQIGREELKRAAGIVAQLRDLQRPSEAEERELTDLHELLRRVLTVTARQCTEQQVEVSLAPSADLPEVMMVPHRVQQVFLNLMLNAVEAMPGGGRLRITTTLSQDRAGVEVLFADSGTGIDPDALPHIFDPFYSGKPEGLGLGLFVSRNIVTDHGGRIEVETEMGEGTTFTVWLPT